MEKLEKVERRRLTVLLGVLAVSSILLIHACAGPPGPPGSQGAPGLVDVKIVRELVENDSDTKSATANCPPGQVAVGGGASTWPDQNTLAPTGVTIQSSRPVGDSSGGVSGTPIAWFGAAHRVPGVGPPIVSWQLQVFAVCSRGPGTKPDLPEAPESGPLDPD
jgi:hypothetical protein